MACCGRWPLKTIIPVYFYISIILTQLSQPSTSTLTSCKLSYLTTINITKNPKISSLLSIYLTF